MLHIFGIRHHGPGSARSLLAALEAARPDIVLVEGPPDAAEVLPMLAHEAIRFPVALLIYAPEAPQRAVFYPFAEFSPETVAIRWALEQGVPVRFMDLPITHQMELEPKPEVKAETAEPEKLEAGTEADEAAPETAEDEITAAEAEEDLPAAQPELRRDPLRWLAEAAGYEDSERWWEDLVEHRGDTAGIFEAILEAMTALRAEADSATPLPEFMAHYERRREAWMRQTIRAATKEGFENIAVVCGAWHTPALAETLPGKYSAKDDAATLKNLPKTKVAATWVPWTNDRLSFESGYGAGIESPGWYSHLWQSRDHVATRWLARVAHLMRQEDLDASSAHVIEGVRLAETLAALRGRPLPGLLELNEAARSVLCFGDDAPLKLIRRKLIVGEVLGAVPEDAPAPPIQQDLAREQKRLRFPPEAAQKVVDLDLRKPNDLDRSRLLHRLRLLNVGWGAPQGRGMGKGTFHEVWRVQWQPELAIGLIEAGRWGNTIVEAATTRVKELAEEAPDLGALTELFQQVLLSDLPNAIPGVLQKLEEQAAVASDVGHLMGALPPLARILRYGDVRGTRADSVAHLLNGLALRLFINLPLACASLNDEAATQMRPKFDEVNGALSLLQNEELSNGWYGTLKGMAARESLHGLLAGRAVRLLLDAQALTDDEAAIALGLALSPGGDPGRGAAWIEGFLGSSGLLLLHDERLWQAIDAWVSELSEDAFTPILPLLRRTFSQFPAPERRQMGERVKHSTGVVVAKSTAPEAGFNEERARRVLPVLRQILGVTPVAVEN
jgi:hypothetical protein